MTDLLNFTIQAHGGIEQWQSVDSIDVDFNYSGALLELKGYPGHRTPSVSVDSRSPHAVIQGLDARNDRWCFTPDRVWIERPDGSVLEERTSPRSAFASHDRNTPWDRLHLTYFLGYAMWNYLTVPFLFARAGFDHREVGTHVEAGETWRILEVTYPDDVPAHTKTQKLYFGSEDGMLKRLDYTTGVLGGVGAHYCYDPKNVDGLIFRTLRRVVRRTPEGTLIAGKTSFFLDYTRLRIRSGAPGATEPARPARTTSLRCDNSLPCRL
jgi:hypothetical protein